MKKPPFQRASGDDVLRIWTIYDHPADFPDHFVVREFELVPSRQLTTGGRAMEMQPGEARLASTLAEARSLVPPDCVCLPPDAGDAETVVESWI